jgi:ribosomal peptide maturation radical SAM protein 1
LGDTDWSQFDLVGFTSMFQQQVASLALAKQLKAEYPKLRIVFGGSNCHGHMAQGLLSSFAFIDAVCSGEGDDEFIELVEANGEKNLQLRNFRTRGVEAPAGHRVDVFSGLAAVEPKQHLVDLSTSPPPDFADFFRVVGTHPSYDFTPRLLFETSRGCWWGEKHHCTFCGLNTEFMEFRRKDPNVAVQQIKSLVALFPNSDHVVSFVDNIIPSDYYASFVPVLQEAKLDREFFYEIKINVKEHQVAALAAAGIRHLQPGIESFSDNLLKRMEKGSSRLQNVHFLRMARQYGIHSYWNILTGVPGESVADYEGDPHLFQSLHHLTPPPGVGRIRIDRFSPYFFRANDFGIKNLRPFPAYKLVYSALSDSEIRELAYYYTGDVPVDVEFSEILTLLQPAVDKWLRCSGHAVLISMCFGEGAILIDTRGEQECSWSARYIHGPEWTVLQSLQEVNGESTIFDELESHGISSRQIIDLWCSLGYVIRSSNKLVSVINEWRDGFSLSERQAEAINVVMRNQPSDSGEFVRVPRLTATSVDN